ncbi:MAG TPA: EpsI family protein [Burkholderiales bacterium]|nr:EpsI family protein [Burkholderiales bacterium]
MKNGTLRCIAVGLAMFCASGLALALKPSHQKAADAPRFETVIPQSFGGWQIDPTVVPVVPSPDVQANLDKIYSQIVSRTYINGNGERMMLTVAYGGDQSDALKAHRQEVCYAAQGFEIHGLTHVAMDVGGASIPVTRMQAVRGFRSEPVTYWLTMGDRVVVGRLERLLTQIRYGLAGRIPDGLLVRVSSLSDDPQAAFHAQDQFIRDLLAGMKPQDVPLLIGARS